MLRFMRSNWEFIYIVVAILFAALFTAVANGQEAKPPLVRPTGLKVPVDIKARHAKSWAINKQRLMSLPTVTADSLDYRKMGIITAIRDQSDCGSCHLFAGVFACESSLIKSNQAVNDGKWTLAEQHVMDCANTGDCDGGWPEDTVRFCISQGIHSTQAYGPYTARSKACWTVAVKPFKVIDCGYVGQEDGVPSTQAMKDALVRYGPLIVCVAADNKFMSYSSGVYKDSGSRQINHAVGMVGWETVGTKTIWIVRNSWGTGWGEQGYVRMEEGANQIGYGAVWVVSTALPPPPPDPPNPPLPPTPVGDDSITITVRQNGRLSTTVIPLTPAGQIIWPKDTPQWLKDAVEKQKIKEPAPAPKETPEPPKLELPKKAESTPARVDLLCEATAVVYFDDVQTKLTGDRRTFYSPALEQGSNYEYAVRVVVRGVSRIRVVRLKAGDSVTVDFRTAT